MARNKTAETGSMPTTAEKLRAVRLELSEDVHKLLRLDAAERDTSLGELARHYVTLALRQPRMTRTMQGGDK